MSIEQPGSVARREKAEAMVRATALQDVVPDSPEQTQQLLHDLRVHQIELEMQNDELLRVQAELDATRARYFDLYELAPVGYLTLDEKGVILAANLTAATLLRSTRGEMVDHPLAGFIVHEDQDLAYLYRRRLVDDGEIRPCELRMKRQDGTAFWAHLDAVVSSTEDGTRVFRLAIGDVSERKRMETQNEHERDFLELLAAGRPLPEVLAHLVGHYEELTPGLHAVVALEEPASSFSPVVFAAASAATNAAMCDAASAPDPLRDELSDPESATDRPASWSVPIVGTTGLRLGELSFRFEGSRQVPVADLAAMEREAHLAALAIERERAVAALRDSESFALAILDSVTAEIAVLDKDGVIVAVNRPWRLFALENALETGRPDPRTQVGADYLAACDATGEPEREEAVAAAAGIRSVLDGRTPIFSLEYSCHAPDAQRWFIMRASRFGPHAGGAVITHTNISERKRADFARASLESQLRESQKMEAVGTLAGGIAHDFNNIIAAILGNAEMARSQWQDHVGSNESLDEIVRAARRARDLVQRILSFSRRQPTDRRRISLPAVVEESVRLLRATLPARVAIHVACEHGLPAVLADSTQFEQVLVNLATNAFQAMRGEPGRIDIHLDRVMLDAALVGLHPELHAMLARGEGPCVRVRVRDDGEGMTPETLGRIFDPFFTTKPVDEGTGLGLSVVHGIVEAHEGAIFVESRVGAGTTFTALLPAVEDDGVAAVPEPLSARPRPAASGKEGRRVLYIDDDRSLVQLVTRILERGGFCVSGFTQPKEALAALRAQPAGFDLVVSDYNMPGLSGLDVAREVRSIRPDLPVAITSGFVDETLRANAASAGVKELILKADAIEDLCESFARLALKQGGSTS